jgi:hypothetical protein
MISSSPTDVLMMVDKLSQQYMVGDDGHDKSGPYTGAYVRTKGRASHVGDDGRDKSGPYTGAYVRTKGRASHVGDDGRDKSGPYTLWR